ncbi:MAG: hypothetical protein WD423_07885 [Rhodothermales bacterium]
MQADALAKLLSETATKDDLAGLETRLDAKIDRGIAELRSELGQAIANTRTHLEGAINRVETRIMKFGIAMIVAMASIFTLLDIFID